MLQFNNTTPFPGTIAVLPDPDGVESVYTIVKGTFCLGGRIRLAEKQLPIAQKDESYGDPARSSLKLASDLGLIKPGTDVLLVGTAYAPGGKPVTQAEVSLSVGSLSKRILVFGDRVWQAGHWGVSISEPQPFETMPLVWERAFGGVDQSADPPPKVDADPRNPAGIGFHARARPKELDGLKLPNLEDPKKLISSWKDRPPPAAFAPVSATWEPRRNYAGTYDEGWQKQGAPYLPKDFDPRFFQLAPPDLVSPEYLQGGEPVEITDATRSGRVAFRLPECRIRVTYRLDDREHVRAANLDTVLIEPDQSRLALVWRAVLPCDKKALRVREVNVTLESGADGA